MPKRRHSAAATLNFIRQAGTLLTQNKPYTDRLYDVTAQLCRELGFVGVAIDTYDPSDSAPFVRISHPALAADLVEEGRESASPRAIADFVASMQSRAEPLVVADPGSSTTTPRLAAYFRAAGVRTLAAFPIVHQDEMIGTIWCSSREAPEPAQASFGIVQLLTPYLATFIRAALNETRAVFARERLAESEARFRSLVQNASDVITVVDRTGRLTYVSASVKRILGYEEGELVGANIVSFVHPDDRIRAAESLQAVARQSGDHRATELRIQHRDGSWRTVETIANNLLDDPAIGGIVHNSRDVTERREAERALQESEQRFRRLAEHSPVGIYQMSTDRTELYLNPAALEIFEADSADEVAKAGHEQVFSATSLQTMSIEQSKRSMGIASNYEVALTGLRGSSRTVLISGAPLFDNADQLQSVIGTITDITERKTLEEALRHQAFHDSLTRLANRARFTDRLEHAIQRA